MAIPLTSQLAAKAGVSLTLLLWKGRGEKQGPPCNRWLQTPAISGPQGRRNLEQGIWPGFSCELGLGPVLSRLQYSLSLTFKNMNNNINKDDSSVGTAFFVGTVLRPGHLHYVL